MLQACLHCTWVLGPHLPDMCAPVSVCVCVCVCCRYSVGMAISAYQKGRMLLVSADKAPATGCILFESLDGGRSWVNISDDVIDAAASLTEHATDVLEHTPLALFVPGEEGHTGRPC